MDKNAPLYIDYCSYKAAKYACENWHYSKAMPYAKTLRFGVWESGIFKGTVIFGRGANPNFSNAYNLKQSECCELVRIALKKHDSTVSKIISVIMFFIKRNYPKIKLIVSYADPDEGHIGGIYKAGNWIYVGETSSDCRILYKGKWFHRKTIYAKGLNPNGMPKKKTSPKYKYLYPLDKSMRQQIESLRKPYPKRAESIENDAHNIPVVTGRCDSDLGAPSKDNV
jgi:hypothetical protein